MELQIITQSNPLLRQRSIEVDSIIFGSKELLELIKNMSETMKIANGIGLAAPQVAKLWRVIIVNNNNDILPFINPRILSASEPKENGEEGCLSIPNTWGIVNRATRIKLEAYTPYGKIIEIKASRLFARVIQHEIDHLDGVLFIDKATDVKKIDPAELKQSAL